MLLEELTLDLPTDSEELRILGIALADDEGKKERTESKDTSWMLRIANIVLLAILVLILICVSPSEMAFGKIKNGLVKLVCKVVVFAMVFTILVLALIR